MTNPKEWGPSLWTSLLYIALNYPDSPTIDEKNDFKAFFTNLGRVLPCMDCRKNYCDHLKVIPIDIYLDGQPALLNWLWRVHNQVNDFCGKPRKSFPDFLRVYLKSADQSQVPVLASKQTGGGADQTNYTQYLLYLAILIFILMAMRRIKCVK